MKRYGIAVCPERFRLEELAWAEPDPVFRVRVQVIPLSRGVAQVPLVFEIADHADDLFGVEGRDFIDEGRKLGLISVRFLLDEVGLRRRHLGSKVNATCLFITFFNAREYSGS